jgi:hypothetical protein
MTAKKTTTKKAAKESKAKSTRKTKAAEAPAEVATTPTVEATAAKTPRAKTAKPSAGDDAEKLSAIDAAAKVLAETNEPLNCKQMIEAMAAKGYWSSPGGKTPHATLYSAILREITAKGNEARFKKTERGHFTING